VQVFVRDNNADTLRGLIEGVVASSSLREKMLQLWIRGAGYQTEVPFRRS
jgi:hypothetical protein